MKFKQVCPECYFELVIEKLEDAVKKCPNCNGREISRQKIVAIDEKENIEENATDISEEEKETISWNEWIEDDTLQEKQQSSIILKYVQGMLRNDFEIRVDAKDDRVLLGRSGLGKEYFQYDTRISNEHIYVVYKEGIWLIEDNGSTNGTMLNEKIIQPHTDYEINDGDVITLGKSNNSVRLEVKINAGS